MRVSDSTFHEANRRNLSMAQSKLHERQEKAALGREVIKPSDDPVSMAMAMRERVREQRQVAHQRAVDVGRTTIEAQDHALGEIADLLRQAQSAAVQGANDTLSAADRAGLASLVGGLRDQALALANSEVADRYVFAGFLDDAPPFDAAGVFVGSNDVAEHEIADGLRSPAGVSAQAAFDVGGAEDLFQILEDLQTALSANDELGIRAGIDEVELAHVRVGEARSEVGSHQNAYDTADAVAQKLRDAAIARQSELVEADEVDLFVELQRAQSAYSAAVQVASQLPPQGLAQS